MIFLPKLNELYYADENGAFLNGNLISVNNLDVTKGLYSIEGPGKLAVQSNMETINLHYREFNCSAVNFAWVACGKLSAAYLIWDTLCDYIPGQYLVKQAGGVIFNDTNEHIAANNDFFLKILRENCS